MFEHVLCSHRFMIHVYYPYGSWAQKTSCHCVNLKLAMHLYISIQLLHIWWVEKVDESLWYAWLLQHLNVSMAVQGNSNKTWSIERWVCRRRNRPEGNLPRRQRNQTRRWAISLAWKICQYNQRPFKSLHNIHNQSCLLWNDGVEHGFDCASGKISRARLGLVFCGRLWWFADVYKDVPQLSPLMFVLPKPPSRLVRWRSARRNCRGSCYM